MREKCPIPALRRITRENLDRYIVRGIWGGHGAKAELKVIEVEGKRYVVKDFSGKGFFARLGLGRFLIGREWKIYRRLRGVEGIPEVYCRIDPEAFIMEYIESKPLKDYNKEIVPNEFIHRLERLVEEMHKRGVIHLDLHQRRNILVTSDWRPYLLDFATSLYFGRSAFTMEVLIPVFRVFDESGILKIKKWHAPETFSDREKRKLKLMEKFRRVWFFTPVHVSKRQPPSCVSFERSDVKDAGK